MLGLTGCPNDEEAPAGGTDGNPSICDVCEQSTQLPPAKCVCDDENAADEDFACWSGPSDCEDYCQTQLDGQGMPKGVGEYIELPCSNSSIVGSCTGWSPSSNVRLVSGTYQIDETFAEGLAFDDSAPLWSCDDAKIISVAGGFEVAGADSGELLYEIGLRNGDQIQTINGQDVTTWAGAEKVFKAFLNGTSTFTVAVQRGTSSLNLSWSITP